MWHVFPKHKNHFCYDVMNLHICVLGEDEYNCELKRLRKT